MEPHSTLPSAPAPSPGHASVLLVDDGEDDAAFVRHVFSEGNYGAELRVAEDGSEALDVLLGPEQGAAPRFRIWPRVVILDLKLPKVGGLEVLRAIRGHPQGRALPVVILSSSQEKRDVEACYQLGANSYLVKPMDFDEFEKLLQSLFHYWAELNMPP